MGRAVGGTAKATVTARRGAAASAVHHYTRQFTLLPVDGIVIPDGPLAAELQQMQAQGMLRERGGRLVPDWRHDGLWKAKLLADRDRQHALPAWLQDVARDATRQATGLGAESVMLFETAATDARAEVDLLVVGGAPLRSHGQLTVTQATSLELAERLAEGDIVAHTALREGLVLHDSGPLRGALARTAASGLRPSAQLDVVQTKAQLADVEHHLQAAPPLLAQRKLRQLLTQAAQHDLLQQGVLPGCRAQLPTQLQTAGNEELATALLSSNQKPNAAKMHEDYQLARRTLLPEPQAPSAPASVADRNAAHEQRLQTDPVYAKAYERARAEREQPSAPASAAPTHEQRLQTDPVYAQAYERALAAA